jgi:iron complex outermembrane receptor protein
MKILKLHSVIYLSLLFLFNFDAQAQSSAIEEVIVSAEKRDESLQDVSLSVTALTEQELEIKNITDFVGLSAIAPGVTVAKNEGYKTIISIRGVGDETNQNAIAAPSVALHMDGIFVASKFSLRTDFIDLERIEVLVVHRVLCLVKIQLAELLILLVRNHLLMKLKEKQI